MISEKAKRKIDLMTKDELRLEVNKGTKSIFQGEKYAYVKTRLEELDESEKKEERKVDISHQKTSLFYSKLSIWVALFTSVLSMVVGTGWYQEHQKNKKDKIEANHQITIKYLEPISILLSDNKAIYEDLKSEKYFEPGWGILESFLIKIRRDGVKKNSLMKKRIEKLVANNNEILILLKNYLPQKMSTEFGNEADNFRKHALRYADRWAALLEIYESGGKFPTAAPIFPKGFPAALKKEIELRTEWQP